MHRALKIKAAKDAVSLRQLTEHLIRLGMIAEAEKQERWQWPSDIVLTGDGGVHIDEFMRGCSDE